MEKLASLDPVMKRFRDDLVALYGDRLERVVLFGSRARGDAHPDSDYDVAVFLKGMQSRWDEIDKIAEIQTDIIGDYGALIQALPYNEGAYNDRTPLMHELRLEGRDIL